MTNYFEAPEGTLTQYPSYKIDKLFLRGGMAVRSPNWLGDAVMSLPAMLSLRTLLPESSPFIVICPDNLYTFFKSLKFIDKVIVVGDGHSRWKKEVTDSIKEINVKVGFLFLNSFRSAYLMRRAGISHLFGASNGVRDFLLKRSYKVKWNNKNGYETKHQAYKYLEMVYSFGCEKWDGTFYDFSIMQGNEFKTQEIPAFMNKNNILVLAPGAAYGPAKRWPAESYAQVANKWINKYNGNIAIVGAASEKESAKIVEAALPKERCLNTAGRTSLSELIYVLSRGAMCVSNDSGVMHLGYALGVKGVAVFGSTDPFATGPLGRKWAICMKQQKCSPCFSRECINQQKDYICLNSITPKDVFDEIEKIF